MSGTRWSPRWFVRPSDVIWDYVTADEDVYFDHHPDLGAWGWTQWPVYLTIVVLVVLVKAASGVPQAQWLGAWFVVALFGLLLTRLCRQVYTRYVVTDRRVMRASGVLRRDHEWMAWPKVTDVAVQRSLLDRWFDTATIQIHSASEKSTFTDMYEVPNPDRMADLIAEMVPKPV